VVYYHSLQKKIKIRKISIHLTFKARKRAKESQRNQRRRRPSLAGRRMRRRMTDLALAPHQALLINQVPMQSWALTLTPWQVTWLGQR